MVEATLPLPSHSSILLISRLDHLEFIMKYLERKHRGGSNRCAEKQCMPLDLAIKETYFKGSLLDRVASLEDRLFQLCLEMDSSSSTYPSSRASAQASGASSSSQSTRTEMYHSFPTFNNNLPTLQDRAMPHNHSNNTLDKLHLQEKSGRQRQMKNASPPKRQEVKNRRKKNEKKSKEAKKRAPPSWPHFKLLDC